MPRDKKQIGLERVSIYSLWERIKYTYNNKFFIKTFPYIASDFDIHINNLWKDLK